MDKYCSIGFITKGCNMGLCKKCKEEIEATKTLEMVKKIQEGIFLDLDLCERCQLKPLPLVGWKEECQVLEKENR